MIKIHSEIYLEPFSQLCLWFDFFYELSLLGHSRIDRTFRFGNDTNSLPKGPQFSWSLRLVAYDS